MNFCYCIGGTGARVAEAAAHLCVANLVGEQNIEFVIVDKDSDCGGTEQARSVIENVSTLSDAGNENALARSNIIDHDETKYFCKSNIKTKEWSFSRAFAAIGVNDNDHDSSVKDSLAKTPSDRILLDAFYSETEQNKDTKKGFYGHPSIGALIFEHMVKYSDENLDIAAPVVNYLVRNPEEVVKVFIIGSIFGGTGASIFSNLASYIRKKTQAYSNRVYIAGTLLLPYFSFEDPSRQVNPLEFYPKSKVALQHYAQDKNLFRKDGNQNGVFDRLYICGQNPLHYTSDRKVDETGAILDTTGGKNQNNHIDFVDLIAAKAMTEFFVEENVAGGNIYEYRLAGQTNQIVSLDATVGMKNELVAMLIFSSFFISKIYAPIKKGVANPWELPIVELLFGHEAYDGGFLKRRSPSVAYEREGGIKSSIESISNAVYDYCKSFVRFVFDLSKNGYNWSTKETDDQSNYNLFSKEFVFKLYQLYFKDIASVPGSDLDAIATHGDYLAAGNAATPNEIMQKLTEKFENKAKAYADVDFKKRVGDFIHEAFNICFESASNC